MVSILQTAGEILFFLHQTFSEVRYEKENSFKLFWQRDTHSGPTETDINIHSCLPFLARILGCTVLVIFILESWFANTKKCEAWKRTGTQWACPPKPCAQAMGWPGCWRVRLLGLNWAAQMPCAPAPCRWWQEMLISRGSMRRTGRAYTRWWQAQVTVTVLETTWVFLLPHRRRKVR